MIKAIGIDKLKADKCYEISDIEEDALVEIDIISGEYFGINGNPPIKSIDVIQKEKIDKAIEEMNNIDLNKFADNTYQLVNECINILKSNIGVNR